MPWTPREERSFLSHELSFVYERWRCHSLRCHLSLDHTAKQASWNPPCLKTDCRALGKVRSWDCVCGYLLCLPRIGTSLCRTGSKNSATALPWFPDMAGNTVEKTMVVKQIESAASRLGLPLISQEDDGGEANRISRKSFGPSANFAKREKHTHRGYPELGGLPVWPFLLLARGSSDVIARSVAEVPLTTISIVCFRSGCAMDLHELTLRARRRRRSKTCRQRSVRPSWMNCGPPRLPLLITRAGSWYLPRCSGGETHVVANRAVDFLPVDEWRTGCGWKFGLADFEVGLVFDLLHVGNNALRYVVVGLTSNLVVFGRPANWSTASSLKETLSHVYTLARLCLSSFGCVELVVGSHSGRIPEVRRWC